MWFKAARFRAGYAAGKADAEFEAMMWHGIAERRERLAREAKGKAEQVRG
jgi:hypothetical protein